jgi:hypothetical protein
MVTMFDIGWGSSIKPLKGDPNYFIYPKFYACCYCGVTKQTQKQIVEHTIKEHPTNDTSIPFNNYG